MLSVTDVGLDAIARAEEGGFLLNIVAVKMSELDVSGLTATDYIRTEGLRGPVVYSGEVANVEVVASATVKFSFRIPANFPADGSTVALREIGLYLDSGDLFAYGPLEPAYDKSKGFSLLISAIVVARRLSEVINVFISRTTSLPATPFVRSLARPRESNANAVLVLDEGVNDYGDEVSTSLAIKSGPGMSEWGFVGYQRIYRGGIDGVIDGATFSVHPDRGGWWLNNKEEVIVQIVAGMGDGFSRRTRYLKKDNTFTVVDKEWPRMGTDSVVAIWRNLKNTLPSRGPGFDENYVLGHGLDTWKQERVASTDQRYTAKAVAGIADAAGRIYSPVFQQANETATLVFVNERLVPIGGFLISGDSLRVDNTAGLRIDVLAFIPDTSAKGMLAKFEAVTDTDGISSRYYTSIVPDNSEWVVAFLNGNHIPSNQYTLEPTSVLFATPPAKGVLNIVTFANYDEMAFTQIRRYIYSANDGDELVFDMDADEYDKYRVMAFVNGKCCTDEDFELDGDNFILKTAPDWGETPSAIIEVLVLSTSNAQFSETHSGTDTGPEWIDPAGKMGPPNRIVPKIISYVSDGLQRMFSVYNVPNKESLIVIAGGGAYQYMDEAEYVRSIGSTISLGRLTLPTAIPKGLRVDIICLQDVRDEGTLTRMEYHKFTTGAGQTYTVPASDNKDAAWVFAGGAYQHRGTYTLDGTNLYLHSHEPGVEVCIAYLKSDAAVGMRTEVYRETFECDQDNTYELLRQPANENIIPFLGSVFQVPGSFDAVPHDEYKTVSLENVAPKMLGLKLEFFYLVSGPPLTRLITRTEFESVVFRLRQQIRTIVKHLGLES